MFRSSNDGLGPLPAEEALKRAYYYTETGDWRGPDVDEWDRWHAVAKVAVAHVEAERERAARVCDDEARIRVEAGATHPEDSPARDRCYAAARAAINCAKGVRGGEVVGPNVALTGRAE